MTLQAVCREFGPLVPPLWHNGVPCDGALVLWAFAGVESSFGRDRYVMRFEPSYSPGGKVYRASPFIRDLWRQHGPDAARSFGSWQMMFPTAVQLGYTGTPEGLADDRALAPLVCAYMKRAQGGTLENAADAYNSGNWRDRFVPLDYLARIVRAYEAGWPPAQEIA